MLYWEISQIVNCRNSVAIGQLWKNWNKNTLETMKVHNISQRHVKHKNVALGLMSLVSFTACYWKVWRDVPSVRWLQRMQAFEGKQVCFEQIVCSGGTAWTLNGSLHQFLHVYCTWWLLTHGSLSLSPLDRQQMCNTQMPGIFLLHSHGEEVEIDFKLILGFHLTYVPLLNVMLSSVGYLQWLSYIWVQSTRVVCNKNVWQWRRWHSVKGKQRKSIYDIKSWISSNRTQMHWRSSTVYSLFDSTYLHFYT